MSLKLAQAGVEHGRCRLCDHDLCVKGELGQVYCSNRRCSHWRHPHHMRDNISIKGAAIRKVTTA